jgi:hypothetical protein
MRLCLASWPAETKPETNKEETMKYGKTTRKDIYYNPANDYTEVEEIGGSLDVYGADARKAFPNLKTIGGWLHIRSADTRKAFPKLTTIGRSLDVRGADTLTAFPKLTTIGRSLDVRGADTLTAFPKLTTIGGSLDVCGADTLTAFPNLKIIGGWLFIYGTDVRKAFPKLTTIGEWLYVSSVDTLATFPNLKTIGGWLYMYGADERKVFPKLKHENRDKAKQIARKKLSRSLLKAGYMLQDGILSKHIASRKLSNGMIVHTQIIVGKTYKTYVIETPDGVYAHGDTVKYAREALLYKLSENRDTTPYKAWTLDTSITKQQAIQSYMAITGACATGVQHFVKTTFGNKVPARTTVREVIALTRGQYSNCVYEKFFTENSNEGTK